PPGPERAPHGRPGPLRGGDGSDRRGRVLRRGRRQPRGRAPRGRSERRPAAGPGPLPVLPPRRGGAAAMTKTLVAGIGNIFNRDDGFGSAVAQRLLQRPVPDGVRVEDYGIRGMHLALDLLEGYDLL